MMGAGLSGGCVKTPPLILSDDIISVLGMEVVYVSFHRRFRPPADDVAA
jgi:hypothetical protein